MALKIIDLAAVKEKGRASFERIIEVLGWVEGSRQGWGLGKGRRRVETNSSQETVPPWGFNT